MEMRLGARRLLPTRLSLQLLFLTSAGQQHPHGALDLRGQVPSGLSGRNTREDKLLSMRLQSSAPHDFPQGVSIRPCLKTVSLTANLHWLGRQPTAFPLR